MAKYRCTVCNYIFDEDAEGKKFSELLHSYTCPICGAPKTAFVHEGISRTDESITTTVADKIIEQLIAFGVKHIVGIPGDSNLPLVNAIRKNDAIDFILTRHEETAAFMASAHGKITGELGVCMSIAGPGAQLRERKFSDQSTCSLTNEGASSTAQNVGSQQTAIISQQ